VKVSQLKIENLRNISNELFEPAPQLNLITGDNGAGKTSLLEAVYLLARAKSFRTTQHRSPIRKDQNELRLFSEIVDESNLKYRLGLSREGSTTRVRLNGQTVNKLSELASVLPVLLITPNSHRLIEEGPEHRRRLLNWGVFHVEQQYKATIHDFNRALVQRNNALRKGTDDLSVWNRAFVEHAERVHENQTEYFKSWRSVLLDLTNDIDYLKSLDVSFYPGWKKADDITQHLKKQEGSDRERGFTSVGPHRADVQYRVDGDSAKQRLSRGQQKVLISCALIAQSIHQNKITGRKPVMLFDDMDSELDNKSLGYLLEILSIQKNQVLVTTINPQKFGQLSESQDSAMFHVEHGRIA
jgi:DNA replication and repair protein RecF